mmetsp:Transcript_25726/g.28812  ORF Transcript_25726/g.28812 Transcript_25726/m.28812 type:complete len:216 (+) Transcript_25726:46-693(+)|eukprot:CAMPEP_0170960052 /NCGR_PEP_ID=MMETSP0735-20130129/36909_1 /TAXON_ID=186038 /ORGANISM="Fragilariopsis kerguelensis, Strain L26-C5" /LENGTH=215 /DNA_ID=CAMNT_0011374769 /DNA_START=21 /DNA_END=668 /DNA_ORIENTATION=-
MMMATKTLLSALCLAFIVAPLGSNISYAQDIILPDDFKAGLESNQFDLVLDIREEDEWNDGNGHIPGAISLPISTIGSRPGFRSQDGFSCHSSCATIVVYCDSGKRSGRVIETLVNEMGFNGTLLNGQGINEWIEAGYELTTEVEVDVPPPLCSYSDICAGKRDDKHASYIPDDSNTAVMAMINGDDSRSSAPASATFWVVAAAVLLTISFSLLI